MNINVNPKAIENLIETRLFQQTAYWSFVKEDLGWEPQAFDILTDNQIIGDVLILKKALDKHHYMAYSPYGPECFPEDNLKGLYLSYLSQALHQYLGPSCIFIRWDIPWESPYAKDPDRYNEKKEWLGPPETRLQELRMNWGVEKVGLRKAPSNYLPHDTIILNIQEDENNIIQKMHPKTRYNIKLADRHNISVREGNIDDINIWNSLYMETTTRNKINPHGIEYFIPLLDKKDNTELYQPDQEEASSASVTLLVAEAEEGPLAAMFMSVSADRATYLYGASSSEHRDAMAPYALQWHAIQKAKKASCTSYDFFGVSTNPAHPMYGLYRFKKGFGGELFHRHGAWDYPYDEHAYMQYQNTELTIPGFNL